MSLPLLDSSDDVTVGNVPGWALVLYGAEPDAEVSGDPVLTITDDQYHADLQATMPGGLEAGTYTFKVRGVTEGDYVRLKEAEVARLYLYWRDVNGTVAGYFISVADALVGLPDLVSKEGAPEDGVVAELAVKNVKRSADGLQYVAEITAQERVASRLKGRVCADLSAADPFGAAENLVRDRVPYELHRPRQTVPPPTGHEPEEASPEVGQARMDVLTALGARMRKLGSLPAQGMDGRPVYLIRDGRLHIGRRDIDAEPAVDLTARGGLLHVEKSGSVARDPNEVRCEDGEAVGGAGSRSLYTLTLKGRPDLKPGHVVRFGAPEAEIEVAAPGKLGGVADYFTGGLLPSLTGEIDSKNQVFLHLNSVEHRLGTTTGFVTTVVGVRGASGDWWDHHSPPRGGGEEADDGDATPEARAARAVQRHARRHASAHRFPEAGEVRAHTVTGEAEPPAQTLGLWRGLAPGDGRAHGARRLDIQRTDPHAVAGVPYLTPFAWGRCGLVLPYYPGVRALLAHRNGREEDSVALGAMWESGQGPAGAEAGDWWLSLPTEVPEAERSSLADGKTPEAYAGKVTHDLTDASGNRVIEVGELTIRIGREALGAAGGRPGRTPEADSVTIEHADGNARLVMKPDGSVLIQGTSIALDAGDGDITMSANNVNVSVQGAMDVS